MPFFRIFNTSRIWRPVVGGMHTGLIGRDPCCCNGWPSHPTSNPHKHRLLWREREQIPPGTLPETADQLCARWLEEWRDGSRPACGRVHQDWGRWRTVVPLHRKLVQAAAQTHLVTGLTIAAHRATALPHSRQLDTLKQLGSPPARLSGCMRRTRRSISTGRPLRRARGWSSIT
jgi:hypothetical protein